MSSRSLPSLPDLAADAMSAAASDALQRQLGDVARLLASPAQSTRAAVLRHLTEATRLLLTSQPDDGQASP